MRVINVQILLIMIACEILDSLGRKEYQKGSTQVYDCRFWREPKQDIANIIMDNHIDEGGSVFYYWDSDSKNCRSCSVCPEKILSECTYVKDTQCMTQMEWMMSNNYDFEQFENKLRSERKEDEGVVVWKAQEPITKQPDVFGKPVYTDESSEEKDSPTRTIQRKYGPNRNFGKKIDGDTEQSFGRPTFFAKDSSKTSNQRTNERPILAILREVLKNNQSRNISVKDVVSVSKGHADELIKDKPDTKTHFGRSDHTHNTYRFQYPGHEHMLDTTRLTETTSLTTTQPTTIKTTTSTTTTTTIATTSYQSINLYESDYAYHDQTKDIWPYRTDDKYSLFYYHQPKYEDHDDNQDEFYHNSADEDQIYNFDYGSRAASDHENLNAPYIGQIHEANQPIGAASTQSTIMQDSTALELDTAILERIFFGVACLVILLVCILIFIITKNRYRQASFKLLDNADGVSSYHSVSPANTTLRTSSPISPQDISGEISSHCSVTRDLVALSRSPTPRDETHKTRYDRSKLSIPLPSTSTSPVFTPESSRSSSEQVQPLKSPLTLLPLHSYKAPAGSGRCPPSGSSSSMIPPAVARSLRNINPVSSYPSKIDKDLENKLFN